MKDISNFLEGKDPIGQKYHLIEEEHTKQFIAMQEKRRIERNAHNGKYFRKFYTSKTYDQELTKLLPNISFWLKFILTFRLSLNSVSKLLRYDDLVEIKYFFERGASRINPMHYHAVKYLFEHYSIQFKDREELHFKEAQVFLKELSLAQLKKDMNKIHELNNIINDSAYIKISKANKHFNDLTEEEKEEIIKFRLKYALSYDDIPCARESWNNYQSKKYEAEIKALNDFLKDLQHNKYYRFSNKKELKRT